MSRRRSFTASVRAREVLSWNCEVGYSLGWTLESIGSRNYYRPALSLGRGVRRREEEEEQEDQKEEEEEEEEEEAGEEEDEEKEKEEEEEEDEEAE
jgi:hypothetical protein